LSYKMKIIKEGNASVKVKVCLVRFDHIASFIVNANHDAM